MIDLITAHAGSLALVLLVLIAAGVMTASWEALSLWMLSAWHSLPLVGGIAWLARRQKSGSRSDGPQADSTAVLSLCSSYAKYIRVLNRADYDNYMNYLRKAGDLGRTPFPPYLRVVIFSMVLIEAAGLAYVLAGWTLPGASEFAQRIAALGIGFLIAVILVFFTHWAGLEIDQSNRYRRDRREWLAAGAEGPLYGPDLSLNDPQNVDDHEPAYRQRATRGHGKSSYVLTTITLIMVLAVGCGAAFVRGQVLEQEIVSESANQIRAMQRFGMTLPDAASGEAAAADRRVMQEEISIKRRGGWGTLLILVVIFFFLQLLGIFFGYRHSFNGRLSKDAYRALMADRFSSYSELLLYYDRIADLAQSKLERLQQLLEYRQRDGLVEAPRAAPYSFRDYLQTREAQRRQKPLGAEGGQPAPAAAAPVNGRVPGRQAPQARLFETTSRRQGRAADASELHGIAMVPVGPIGNARAQLEQAEQLERERAAERAARSRGSARRKTAALTEPETR
jgi:hypothetical protein